MTHALFQSKWHNHEKASLRGCAPPHLIAFLVDTKGPWRNKVEKFGERQEDSRQMWGTTERTVQKIKAGWHIRKASLLCFKGMEVTCGRPTCFSVAEGCNGDVCHRMAPCLYFNRQELSVRSHLSLAIAKQRRTDIIIISSAFQMNSETSRPRTLSFSFLTISTFPLHFSFLLARLYVTDEMAVRAVIVVKLMCIMNAFTLLWSFITWVPQNSCILSFKLALSGYMNTFWTLTVHCSFPEDHILQNTSNRSHMDTRHICVTLKTNLLRQLN